MKSKCSIEDVEDMVSYLNKYLTIRISNPTELFSLNDTIAKYPLSLERKTKRVFYAYMPKEFTNEVEQIDLY